MNLEFPFHFIWNSQLYSKVRTFAYDYTHLVSYWHNQFISLFSFYTSMWRVYHAILSCFIVERNFEFEYIMILLPSSVSSTTTSVYIQVHAIIAMTFNQKEKKCYDWTIQVDMNGLEWNCSKLVGNDGDARDYCLTRTWCKLMVSSTVTLYSSEIC